MCCSVLQCDAVTCRFSIASRVQIQQERDESVFDCCSVLQRVAACCSVLQSIFERKSSAKSSFSSAQCKARVHTACCSVCCCAPVHSVCCIRHSRVHSVCCIRPNAFECTLCVASGTLERLSETSHAKPYISCFAVHTRLCILHGVHMRHRMQNLWSIHSLCTGLHRFCIRCVRRVMRV